MPPLSWHDHVERSKASSRTSRATPSADRSSGDTRPRLFQQAWLVDKLAGLAIVRPGTQSVRRDVVAPNAQCHCSVSVLTAQSENVTMQARRQWRITSNPPMIKKQIHKGKSMPIHTQSNTHRRRTFILAAHCSLSTLHLSFCHPCLLLPIYFFVVFLSRLGLCFVQIKEVM